MLVVICDVVVGCIGMVWVGYVGSVLYGCLLWVICVFWVSYL